MKPITLLLVITIALTLTSCALAEAQLVEAETELAQTNANADAQSDLVDLANRLLDELGDERDNTDETIDALLAVIEDFAESQKPRARWDVVALALIVAVAVIAWRVTQKPQSVVVVPQLGDGCGRAALPHGELWLMEIPQDIDVEAIER